MDHVVNLDSEQFVEFLRCLSLLRDICNDADIREGVVRQRTNDNSSIFEVDMRSLIQNVDLPISNLKQKLDLLKIFSEQEEVAISVEEGSFSISDQYSVLRFVSPKLDFMDNKFMNEEELNSIITLNEEDLVLGCEILKVISDRMRIITQSFNVNTVKVNFNEETASITTETQARDQQARILSDIVSNRVMKSTSNLVAIPFVIDHDGDMELKMYNVKENVLVNMFSAKISDVNITVFSRSLLAEVEE